jgi:3-dehydroquinate dehydratase II
MTLTIVVLNGPNLNLLGTREPDVYGRDTLADIERLSAAHATSLGLTTEFRQSNSEGTLIDWVHGARRRAQGFIINAGAFTHTSIALLDALLSVELPVVEVHLSNLFKRESFRHHSYITRAALGLICGFGAKGYLLALDALAHHLNSKKASA